MSNSITVKSEIKAAASILFLRFLVRLLLGGGFYQGAAYIEQIWIAEPRSSQNDKDQNQIEVDGDENESNKVVLHIDDELINISRL